MATNYQFTRIEKIYPSKEDALGKLSCLSLPFGTGVAIRYQVKNTSIDNDGCGCGCCCCSENGEEINSKLNILLALYITEEPGDFTIIADSEIPVGGESNKSFTVYRGAISEGQNSEDAIAATLFGKQPKEKDIIVLENKELGISESYIYVGKEWICLGKESAGTEFNSEQFDSKGEIKIKKIYGGTF